MAWEYDWHGRRVRQTEYDGSSGSYVVAQDLKLLYDGWHCIAELNATNHALVRSYLWGLDLSGSMTGARGVGGLLALNSVASGVHFCAYDGNGNVTALVKGTDGTNSANYEFDPFGQTIRCTGELAQENAYRFSTKRADEATDLVHYEFRVYRPSTGTWPSRDPINELGFNPVATSEDNVRGAELSRLAGMALRRDKNFKETLKAWLLLEAARNGSRDFEMLPHIRPEELNTYRFTANDAVNQIDVNGLIGTPIFYACPSIKCGLYMCIGYFDFKNRFPRHPLDLYLCLDSMKKTMDFACLTANHADFDAGCRGTLDCFKAFW